MFILLALPGVLIIWTSISKLIYNWFLRQPPGYAGRIDSLEKIEKESAAVLSEILRLAHGRGTFGDG